MTTRAITLTKDWQQITTGIETAFVQCAKNRIALCESSTEPANDIPFISVSEAQINPPATIWAKSFVPGSELVIIEVDS